VLQWTDIFCLPCIRSIALRSQHKQALGAGVHTRITEHLTYYLTGCYELPLIYTTRLAQWTRFCQCRQPQRCCEKPLVHPDSALEKAHAQQQMLPPRVLHFIWWQGWDSAPQEALSWVAEWKETNADYTIRK